MITKRYALTGRIRQKLSQEEIGFTVSELDNAKTKFDCIMLLTKVYGEESNVGDIELTPRDYENLKMIFHALSMPNFKETSYLNQRVIYANKYLDMVRESEASLADIVKELVKSYTMTIDIA